MKKYKELDDFYFEPFLKREKSTKPLASAIRYFACAFVVLIVFAFVLALLTRVLTARAQSVLLYDNARVEAVMEQCEEKVRELL